MNAKTVLSVIKGRGIRYLAFRTFYEFRRRSGLMRWQYPTIYKKKDFCSLQDFRNANDFFFFSREALSVPKKKSAELKRKTESILKGEILFFSHTRLSLGLDYDWITNPDTGYKYDIHQHWTQVEDMDPVAGDIKFVWEKSRFSWLAAVMRYDYHFDDDHSEFVFEQILDWIENNPLNCGPNYKCSQEISIRILNWIMFLNFYKNSGALTEERFHIIINSIYWQIKHVEKNIDFSRICVRNNHAITETLTLYLTSLLLPWLPGSEKRKKNGKRWFEEEITYQIADDGTFIQNSMNYHRVVIQLLTWAIAIADIHGEKFKDEVYEKSLKSVNFLYQCQDSKSGMLPNYGFNDGALFFQLNDNDYRDYRPQLDALHWLLTGKNLYLEKQEDCSWYNKPGVCHHTLDMLERHQGIVIFEDSGYYLFREGDTLTFFRCGGYNSKYGSNDSLHLDIWKSGQNYLIDAGSYKYNTSEELMKYFNGNEAHNTIMLDDYIFMKKGIRFIWNNPTQVSEVKVTETRSEYVLTAKIGAFTYLAPDIAIVRTVKKKKNVEEWTVRDIVHNKPKNLVLRQLWHTFGNNVSFVSDGERADSEGKYSSYYGEYTIDSQIEFRTDSNEISTTVLLKV